MTSGEAARIVRFGLGSLVGGIVLAGLAAPVASAAPDCSPATVEATKATVGQQAQAYMDSHPDGNKVLLTAALQPRPLRHLEPAGVRRLQADPGTAGHPAAAVRCAGGSGAVPVGVRAVHRRLSH